MITKSMFGISLAAIFAIVTIAGLSGQIPFVAADEGETELKAIFLDGDGNKVGEAKYELEDEKSELKVKLKGFTPNSEFDISFAGNIIGTITTDSKGKGEEKWEPSIITVVAGDTISVGALEGTFLAESDDDDKAKKMKKIKGKFSGSYTNPGDEGHDGVCAGSDSEATGKYSAGLSHADSTSCVTPLVVPALTDGECFQTATTDAVTMNEKGDSIIYEIAAVQCTFGDVSTGPETPWGAHVAGVVTVTGGTGKFLDRTGTGFVTSHVDYWENTFDGKIEIFLDSLD